MLDMLLYYSSRLFVDTIAIMIADDAVDHPILSLALVNEVLEYTHIDFKNITYRQGNPLFANDDDDDGGSRRLPVSMILNSRLEDYFADVLLSDRFKKKLCNICAKEGQLESLKWARSKGCPWTQPHQYIKQGLLHVTIDTCNAAAKLNLQVKRLIYLQEVPYTPPSTLGATGLV